MKILVSIYLWNLFFHFSGAFVQNSKIHVSTKFKTPFPSSFLKNKNITSIYNPHKTKHATTNPSYTQPPISLIDEQKQRIFTEEDYNFQLKWYVIAESKQIHSNTLYEAKVWNKTYVYWKNENQYYAIQNRCNHRGALLSDGILCPRTNCVQCPYHGLEFNGHGILQKIPGQKLPPMSNYWNQAKFPIVEKEGWIYLNLISEDIYATEHLTTEELKETIFQEPDISMTPLSRIFCNIPSIPVYSRIVSENLLDILHITYVHSFGNKQSPVPLNEPEIYLLRSHTEDGLQILPMEQNVSSLPIPRPPRTNKNTRSINAKIRAILFRNYVYVLLNCISTNTQKIISNPPLLPSKSINETEDNPEPMTTKRMIPIKNQQYGMRYLFETNSESMIRKIFHFNHIVIETEFLLPHYTISRVRFGNYYKTVVSFALPVSNTETHLFIKLYRNYWIKDSIPLFPFPFSFISIFFGVIFEKIADSLILWTLKETFKEDAAILNKLTPEQPGKYNLKYDKFPFFYRNLYKKYVHCKTLDNSPPFSSLE